MTIRKGRTGPPKADTPKPDTVTARILKLVDRWEEHSRAYSLTQVGDSVGCSRQLVRQALKRWRPKLLKGI